MTVKAKDPMRPLCVDLDGTLVTTDTLHENALKAMLTSPFRALRAIMSGLLAAAFGDRSGIKVQLAAIARPDGALLPYRQEVLAMLKTEKARGRRLVLATGSDRRIANDVATALCLFDEVVATEPEKNMTGKVKAAALVDRFGTKGFDYIGDSKADVPVWRAAEGIWVAGRRMSQQRLARKGFKDETVNFLLPHEKTSVLKSWMHALRLYQWTKNILVFVPVLAAGVWTDTAMLLAGLQAFLIFGLIASGTYLINDLVDIESDRHHPRKRTRAFAAGDISLVAGVFAAVALIGLGGAAAWLVGPLFFATVAAYLALTLLYSFQLKRVPIVDIFALATLYCLRIVAGAAVTGLTLSVWLLNFSGFLFLSLGCLKRVGEMSGGDIAAKTRGRGYQASDRTLLGALGISIGVSAIIVFGLYVGSPAASEIYARPEWLWGITPVLLLWLTRLWLATWRGEVADDPIVTVLRDPVNWFLGSAGLFVFLAAHYGDFFLTVLAI
ncbi:MAG: UbiA family prenyltransferase [Pseudomonadota bacterium]